MVPIRRRRDTAPMSQENVDTVARVYEGWERGDFTASVSLLEGNVTLVIDPGIPDGGGVFVGREGVRTYMTRFLAAWDSLTIAAESLKDVGDTVLVKVKQSGTGRGSGVPVDISFFQLWTFRGGNVIRLETILREEDALDAVGLSE